MNPALRQAIGLLQALRLTVSREQVRWCYRQLLGREPENEAAILAHSRYFTLQGLIDRISASEEYRRRHAANDAAAAPGLPAGAVDGARFRALLADWAAAQATPPSAALREYIEMHFERTLDLLNLVHHLLPQGGRLVDYSATGYFRHALTATLPGLELANVSGVNYELDAYADKMGAGRYDLCLNAEVLEHLLFDPSHMVFSINRMLRPGGHLVLTTPNGCSLANGLRLLEGAPPSLWNQLNLGSRQYYERHNRDWTPFEVQRLLREHGFEVLQTHTRDYYRDTHAIIAARPRQAELIRQEATHRLLGDTTIVLARKTAEAKAPVHGSWLYVKP